MKKLLYPLWSLLLMGSLLTSTSCKDDEGGEPIFAAPSLSAVGVSDPSTTVDVGEPVAFTLNVTAPAGFKNLKVSRKVSTGGTAESLLDHTHTGAATTTYEYPFAYTATEEDAGQQLIFDFLATDTKNQTGSYQYIINVNEMADPEPEPEPVPEPSLVAYSDVRLYAPAPDSSSYTWFNASTGEIYSGRDARSAEIAEGIDFGYFYGTNLNATLASPDFYPKADFGQADWARRNETKLKNTTLTPEDFQNLTTVAQLEEAYETALTSEGGDPDANFQQQRVMRLAKDKVVVFLTDANKPGGSRYGIALVSEIIGTTGRSDYIQLEIKMSPAAE